MLKLECMIQENNYLGYTTMRGGSLWVVCLIFLLFLFGTLFKADTSDEIGLLPEYLQPYLSIARWLTMLFVGTLGGFFISRIRTLETQVWMYFLFYVILLVWSLVEGDWLRYLSISIFVLFIPVFIREKISSIFHLKRLLFVFLTTFVLLVGISLFLNWNGLGYRFSGPFDNPNTFSMANLFFISIAVTLFFLLNKTERVKRWIVYSIFAFFILMQISTGSKAGAAALLAMLVYFLLGYGIKIRTVLLSGIAFVTIILVANAIAPQALERFTTFSDATESGRSIIWETTIDCIKKEPLTGYGTSPEVKFFYIGTDHIHSFYLALLFFMGIPAGVIASLLYLTAAGWGFFSQRKIQVKKIKYAYLASTAFFVGFAVQAIGEEAPTGVGNPIFVYFLIALGVSNVLMKFSDVENRLWRITYVYPSKRHRL